MGDHRCSRVQKKKKLKNYGHESIKGSDEKKREKKRYKREKEATKKRADE
jgi:hypothetical protein